MLVLTRKVNQKIMIGEDISITVIEVSQGKVRLGIEAPRTTSIYREELLPYYKSGGEDDTLEHPSS